jgi:lantibiotic transport system ATP-binding protein
MSSTPIIRISGLTHSFGNDGHPTIENLNMNVAEGSIYGFLGANGSGKTTTLSLILGLLKIQQGRIEVFGNELNTSRIEILRKIGSLIETPSLYGHLTATENLEVYSEIYGVSKERIDKTLQLVRMRDTGKKPAKKFSLGMKQRLALALALLHNPKILILDEPSNGLDPGGIIELREIIRSINIERGITVVISSHILAEVEKLVTHVGIISNSRMAFEGSLGDLKDLQPAKGLEQIFIDLTSTTL